MTKLTSDFEKAAAAEMKATTLYLRENAVTQMAGMIRWIIASLLVVNSGALIAVMNTQAIGLKGKLWAGSLFALGLCGAFLTAYTNVRSARKFIPEISELIGLYSNTEFSGERDIEREKALHKKIDANDRSSVVSDALAWLSLLFFIAGLIVAAMNLFPEPENARNKPQLVEVVIRHVR